MSNLLLQTTNLPSKNQHKKDLKILLIIEQCNPDWPSVPLVSYQFFDGIRQLLDVTLVTHERNRPGLEPKAGETEIVYIPESKFWSRYHDFISKFVVGKKTIWQLYLMLTYPIYAEFNRQVYNSFSGRIKSGEFDVVHAITPMMPRYPVMAIKACKQVPFVMGPINGGVPYPKGFQETAKKEFASLNFLRVLGRFLIPGYVETYKKAAHIISGSTYTLELIKDLFGLTDDRLSLIYENGVTDSIFDYELIQQSQPKKKSDLIELLFVGRLVPYKCADIAINAIAQLPNPLQLRVHLTIVGDGAEREALEEQVQTLGLTEEITFAGWVCQEKIYSYYQQSDIFCFPSIREFGGAVVMEAMACGLPCIVANNGGIGEYVTDETGFRIEPLSREFLTKELANRISELILNETLRQRMSAASIERAKTFLWSEKVKQVIDIYQKSIATSSAEKYTAQSECKQKSEL